MQQNIFNVKERFAKNERALVFVLEEVAVKNDDGEERRAFFIAPAHTVRTSEAIISEWLDIVAALNSFVDYVQHMSRALLART